MLSAYAGAAPTNLHTRTAYGDFTAGYRSTRYQQSKDQPQLSVVELKMDKYSVHIPAAFNSHEFAATALPPHPAALAKSCIMDGLSGAARHVAVINTSAKFASLYLQYSFAGRNAKKNIEHLQKKVADLKSLFGGVKGVLSRARVVLSSSCSFFLVLLFSRPLNFSLSRSLILSSSHSLIFSFSHFLVFSISRFLVSFRSLSLSCFLVLPFSRSANFLSPRICVRSGAR